MSQFQALREVMYQEPDFSYAPIIDLHKINAKLRFILLFFVGMANGL